MFTISMTCVRLSIRSHSFFQSFHEPCENGFKYELVLKQNKSCLKANVSVKLSVIRLAKHLAKIVTILLHFALAGPLEAHYTVPVSRVPHWQSHIEKKLGVLNKANHFHAR